MRSNYRSFWAIIALIMMTAWMSGQPLENTKALLEAVERSDEASIKALLSQGADPNSKNTNRLDNADVPQLLRDI